MNYSIKFVCVVCTMFLLWVILERIYSLVEFFPCFLFFFVFCFTCRGKKCVKQLDCIQQKTTTNFFFSQVLSIFLSITMFMSVCLCNVYVCQYRLIWQKAFFVVVDNETHKRHWFRHLRLFFCWDKNFFLFCFSLIFFLLLLEESEIVSFCRSNKDVYIDDIVFFFCWNYENGKWIDIQK